MRSARAGPPSLIVLAVLGATFVTAVSGLPVQARTQPTQGAAEFERAWQALVEAGEKVWAGHRDGETAEWLAKLYAWGYRLDQGISRHQKQLRATPDDPFEHLLLGLLYLYQAEDLDAREQFLLAVSACTDEAHLRANLRHRSSSGPWMAWRGSRLVPLCLPADKANEAWRR
jgi:hypothetical protein